MEEFAGLTRVIALGLVVVWLILPFMVVGIKNRVDNLIAAQKTTNTLLTNIHTVASTALWKAHDRGKQPPSP